MAAFAIDRRAWLVLAACLLAAPASAEVAEPEGLWTGPMVGDTPATLTGAKVVDVPALESLMAAQPLLVDVGPADRKPDNLPKEAIWKPIHRSIPGAAWFPGAGSAELPPDKVEAFLQRIAELTHGDKAAPIVTFCKPRCWGSWNVGKRLVQAGYTGVHWLPAGVNGWQETHDTMAVQPEPGWQPKPAS